MPTQDQALHPEPPTTIIATLQAVLRLWKKALIPLLPISAGVSVLVGLTLLSLSNSMIFIVGPIGFFVALYLWIVAIKRIHHLETGEAEGGDFAFNSSTYLKVAAIKVGQLLLLPILCFFTVFAIMSCFGSIDTGALEGLYYIAIVGAALLLPSVGFYFVIADILIITEKLSLADALKKARPILNGVSGLVFITVIFSVFYAFLAVLLVAMMALLVTGVDAFYFVFESGGWSIFFWTLLPLLFTPFCVSLLYIPCRTLAARRLAREETSKGEDGSRE